MSYFTTRYRLSCMRPTMEIHLLLFCLMFLAVHLHAQKLSFEYLTVKEGLPRNTIRSIIKDKYGFMWFGTWNGLCRYDWYSFKVYRTIPGDTTSIANSRIHHIYKDSAGTLWVTSFANNISRYNYETDNFTRFKADKLPKPIRDSTNRINSLRALERAAGLLQQHLGPYHLSETKEHFVFETTPNTDGGINDNNVNCVYQDDHGILWLGTATGGVNKADLKAKPFNSFTIIAKNKTSVFTPVRAISVDANSVWIGTQDDGVLYIDRKTNKERWFRDELAGTNVRAVFRDSHGNIWIGDRLGLDRYDTRAQKMIRCFSENTGGTLHSARFYGIVEDPVDRSVWFGTYDKLLRFDPVSNTFEGRSLGTYYSKSGAGCLFFDSKNNLWVGTDYSGLIQVKRNSVTHAFTDTVSFNEAAPDPIPLDDRVYDVTEDEFGNIWAGTANGLYRIDPDKKQVKIFTKQDGLSDQYIAKMFPDKKGNLWISHKNGLSRLTIKTGTIRNYAVKESFHGYEFIESSGCMDSTTGEMYFGGMDGYVSFPPGNGGVNRALIRSTTSAGTVTIKATSPGLKEATLTLTSKPFAVQNGLSTSLPDEGLPVNLERGPR